MGAKIKILIVLVFFQIGVFAQKHNVWVTYSQAKYVYTPGIEGSYFFNRYIGLQLGLNVFIDGYENDHVANISKFGKFNLYSLNINPCTYFIHRENSSIGFTAGAKLINGPDYDLLYKGSDYKIYFNSVDYHTELSIDLGVFYRFKHFTSSLKFDTTRKDFGIGLGYSFGEFFKNEKEKVD